jgi:hypothetical protein
VENVWCFEEEDEKKENFLSDGTEGDKMALNDRKRRQRSESKVSLKQR